MGTLAFTHPGKVGDLLYSLPVAKQICESKKESGDFYTSSYCFPIVKRLIERQSYIKNCFLSDTYKIERMDMGIQPWNVPTNNLDYSEVYHFGFRNVPDKELPAYMAESSNIVWDREISYEFDDTVTLEEPYIVIAPRGESSYKETFLQVIKKSPVKVVIIGSDSDYIGDGINKCGLDLLDTLPWIKNSVGFVGLMSSQLVLANGFDIPKVSPHNNKNWDMRHVINSPTNFYPVNPTAETILELINL